jgi:hypothetical protein
MTFASEKNFIFCSSVLSTPRPSGVYISEQLFPQSKVGRLNPFVTTERTPFVFSEVPKIDDPMTEDASVELQRIYIVGFEKTGFVFSRVDELTHLSFWQTVLQTFLSPTFRKIKTCS